MDREAIRIECLRLKFRHDQTMEDIIRDAKTLEGYVVGPDEGKLTSSPAAPELPKKTSKKSDNPDLFS